MPQPNLGPSPDEMAAALAAQPQVESWQLPKQTMFPGTLMDVNRSPIDGQPITPPPGMALLVIAHPPSGEVMMFQMGRAFARRLSLAFAAAAGDVAEMSDEQVADILGEPEPERVLADERALCGACNGRGETPEQPDSACPDCDGRGWKPMFPPVEPVE